MNSDQIHTEIARVVLACYQNSARDRQISIEVLRKGGHEPNTAEGITNTIRKATAVFEELKAAGVITWYGVFNLNADGPQWIRFQLPPCYARPTVPVILDGVPDGQRLER